MRQFYLIHPFLQLFHGKQKKGRRVELFHGKQFYRQRASFDIYPNRVTIMPSYYVNLQHHRR